MVIRCERCSTMYELDESLLAPGGSDVQCTKCEHVFTAVPPAASGNALGGQATAPAGPVPHAAHRSAAPTPAAARSDGPARVVRTGPPAVYRPPTTSAAPVPRAPMLKRNPVGSFEARLRWAARWRWLAPLVAGLVVAALVAAWVLVRRADAPPLTAREEDARSPVAPAAAPSGAPAVPPHPAAAAAEPARPPPTEAAAAVQAPVAAPAEPASAEPPVARPPSATADEASAGGRATTSQRKMLPHLAPGASPPTAGRVPSAAPAGEPPIPDGAAAPGITERPAPEPTSLPVPPAALPPAPAEAAPLAVPPLQPPHPPAAEPPPRAPRGRHPPDPEDVSGG